MTASFGPRAVQIKPVLHHLINASARIQCADRVNIITNLWFNTKPFRTAQPIANTTINNNSDDESGARIQIKQNRRIAHCHRKMVNNHLRDSENHLTNDAARLEPASQPYTHLSVQLKWIYSFQFQNRLDVHGVRVLEWWSCCDSMCQSIFIWTNVAEHGAHTFFSISSLSIFHVVTKHAKNNIWTKLKRTISHGFQFLSFE